MIWTKIDYATYSSFTIKLYPPKKIFYVGVIRTLINKYQKFRTYLLVNNIYIKILYIGDKTRTCKVKNHSILSRTWLPNFSTPINIIHARDKIRTYNLNIFSVPLNQIELLELHLEISSFDLEITICKIVVLPIKL